ncbi:hypothetical protein ACP70R_038959 [Stipagrostis hirtigluma subsp. patula]
MEDAPQEGEAPVTTTAPHANAAEIVASLPLETRYPAFPLRQYAGFWLAETTVKAAVPLLHARLQPRPDDVLIASFPKSGTTWLIALAFAALNRSEHSPLAGDHPLRHCNPHDCVRFLDTELAFAKNTADMDTLMDELEALPSPRLLATHLPHSLLPERVMDESFGCRIVYICRDPKDALVSLWHFTKKAAPAAVVDAQSFTFQEMFELFCEGRCPNGPQWHHVLQYWQESVRRPDKVMFLRYEEMLREPERNLKKLAKFMGCEFSDEEEEAGVVRAIVELCSLEKMKNMEVNRSGSTKLGVKSESYFRKGVVGDWSRHMTPEMAQKLDKIVRDAVDGSGFTFASLA